MTCPWSSGLSFPGIQFLYSTPQCSIVIYNISEMTETIVSKLGPYHCQSTWTEDSVLLTVLEGVSAWSGMLHQQACKDRDDRSGGALGDSWVMAREAFGAAQDSKYDFVIENKKIIWRKVGGKSQDQDNRN